MAEQLLVHPALAHDLSLDPSTVPCYSQLDVAELSRVHILLLAWLCTHLHEQTHKQIQTSVITTESKIFCRVCFCCYFKHVFIWGRCICLYDKII